MYKLAIHKDGKDGRDNFERVIAKLFFLIQQLSMQLY